jgi:hypothetical protein
MEPLSVLALQRLHAERGAAALPEQRVARARADLRSGLPRAVLAADQWSAGLVRGRHAARIDLHIHLRLRYA